MINKETILNEIVEAKSEIDALRTKLNEKIQANFHELAKGLFAEYEELKSFGWTQYTPYFNDGESCEFSSNHTDPFINGFDEYSDEAWGYFDNGQEEGINIFENYQTRKTTYEGGKQVPNPTYNERSGKIYNAVKDFLNIFDEEDYEALFGDHTSVVVTNDWIETQELEHD